MNQYNFERVGEFNYLETTITSDNDKIKEKLIMGYLVPVAAILLFEV